MEEGMAKSRVNTDSVTFCNETKTLVQVTEWNMNV